MIDPERKKKVRKRMNEQKAITMNSRSKKTNKDFVATFAVLPHHLSVRFCRGGDGDCGATAGSERGIPKLMSYVHK